MQSLSKESEKRAKNHTFVNTASWKNGTLEKRGITKWFLNRMKDTNAPFLNHLYNQSRLGADTLRFLSLCVHHTEILCKRISWIVAQTMVRQLVSVVNTSI
jgi:hypothetical protein